MNQLDKQIAFVFGVLGGGFLVFAVVVAFLGVLEPLAAAVFLAVVVLVIVGLFKLAGRLFPE